MNLVTSPPPDVRIDFGIPLERAEDDWDVDNPFHSAKLVSSDRRRLQHSHHRRIMYENEVTKNLPQPEINSTSSRKLPKGPLVASDAFTDPRAYATIRHWKIGQTGETSVKYDHCPLIIRAPIPETSEPSSDEVYVPCRLIGDSFCWRITAGPEKHPPEGDDFRHRMLLDLASPTSHLYHVDCVIRSPFPAEDPWPSNPDLDFNSHKNLHNVSGTGVPSRYVRNESSSLVLADPLAHGAKSKQSKHWISYADKSKYQIQPHVFASFYFPGFNRPTEVEFADRPTKKTYAHVEDVEIGLNITVNEVGFKSDTDNWIEGVMGLGIPGGHGSSIVERLCCFDDNKLPGFLLQLHKKRTRSFLILNPSPQYLSTLHVEWSNHIDVDPSVLENHWYLTMSSVVFLGEKFDIPTGHMDRLIELDTGSTHCFLHPSIFTPLSRSARMFYEANENLYYLPEDYQMDPSPLQITIATSRLPFVLDVPLGSCGGPKRVIDGKRYVASYFQPQTLGFGSDEGTDEFTGFPENVLGSAFFYYYSIYFGFTTGGGYPKIRISALRSGD